MSVKLDESARWFAGKGRAVSAVTPAGGAGGLRLLDVRYADGGMERYLDVPVELSWADLLRSLPAKGDGGRIELRGAPSGVVPSGAVVERVPATDQSNTLVALGERLLVKAYRRLAPGVHPEVELLSALRDAPVPAFRGSLHWVASDGTDTAIALLQEFVPDAESGWEAPIERALADPPRLDEWRAAGRVAARLHAALLDAFGSDVAAPRDLGHWRADAEAALAAAADPEVDADAVRSRLAAFDRLDPPLVTRIHGDLHVAQLLRTGAGDPLVIDFEGDPTRPLAERRRPDTPLRDLAGLLRSIDHVGSAASRRAGGAAPDAWIAAARAAALDAYAELSPVPVDPALLTALEVAKECFELVYAARVLPEWRYAPREGLRRLLEAA